jgi:hypothetical protein
LDCFARDQIDVLCQRFGIRRQRAVDVERPGYASNQAATGQQHPVSPISLALLGWSLASCEFIQSPMLQKVLAHFRDLHQHLGIPFDDFVVWNPPSDVIDRVRFCLNKGIIADASEALNASLDEDCQDLIEIIGVRTEPPNTYADALQRWQSLSRPSDAAAQQNAWKLVEQFQDRDIIAPLLRQAAGESDPIDQAQTLALVDISRLLHPHAVLLAAKYASAIRENGTRVERLLDGDELKQMLAMTDRAITLTQRLKKWRRKSKSNDKASRPGDPTLYSSRSA